MSTNQFNKTCCFIGHREIAESEELIGSLFSIVENLILEHRVDTFLFGSKSRFNSLCYETVTRIKQKYPHIKRVYVRAEFLQIDDAYKSCLLERYEETYFPKSAQNAGKAVYVKRNFDMINKSSFCVFYYKNEALPKGRKSGTKIALSYAAKLKKEIVCLP